MPVPQKLPEWERMDNRSKVFSTILENSLTFTELLNETGFSRATLSNHLRDLQQDGIIEKAIDNDRVVYRITFDEERLESEIKKVGYDALFNFVSSEHPTIALLMKTFMKTVVRLVINSKISKIEGTQFFITNELLHSIAESVISEYSEEEIGIFSDSKFVVALLNAVLEEGGIRQIFNEVDST